jgi:hypothetical protein
MLDVMMAKGIKAERAEEINQVLSSSVGYCRSPSRFRKRYEHHLAFLLSMSASTLHTLFAESADERG